MADTHRDLTMGDYTDKFGAHQFRTQLYIDGEWRDAADGQTFSTTNPANNNEIGQVAQATESDVDDAIDAARRALDQSEWGEMEATERGQCLRDLAAAIRDRQEELARLETLDCGRPLHEAGGVIGSAASHLEYYADLTDKIQGETIPVPGGRFSFTVREPYGVSVHIVPWNAPFSLAFRDIAPALACGNAIVAKPSTKTPLTALEMGELAAEAGFPDGVLNVVPGPGNPTGSALVSHKDTDRTTFTGSLATGRKIMKLSAQTMSPVNLELGGKSPNIVFPDADLEAALDGAIRGIFRNAGQMCIAGSRLFLHEDIHDDFIDRLVERAESLRIGPGLDEGIDIGPVVSAEDRESILEYIEVGRQEGATLVTGGGVPDDPSLPDGNYVEPTIFTDVNNGMRIAQEEIFGPVLCVLKFSSREEVIREANDTEFGLYAGIWTNDLERAHDIAGAIESGYVAINEYPVLFPATPFGGYKKSGLGRERGIQVLDHYTQLKSVLMNFENT